MLGQCFKKARVPTGRIGGIDPVALSLAPQVARHPQQTPGNWLNQHQYIGILLEAGAIHHADNGAHAPSQNGRP